MLLYLFYGQTSWQKSMKTNISCIIRRKLLPGVPSGTSTIFLSPSLSLSYSFSFFLSVSLWSPTSPQETRSSPRVTFVMSIFCDSHQSRIAIAVAVVVAVVVAAFVVVVVICWLPRCVLTSDCVRVLSFSGHTQRGPPRTVDRVEKVYRGQQAAPRLSVEN